MLISELLFLTLMFLLLANFAKPNNGLLILDRIGGLVSLLCLVVALICYGLWLWR